MENHKIGEVLFEVVSPCARCILTTIDPITSIPNTLKEPMKTLSKFRSNGEGDVFFGQNVIALNEDIIYVNDPVTVIEFKEVEDYQNNMDVINELVLIKKEKISRDFISFYFELI